MVKVIVSQRITLEVKFDGDSGLADVAIKARPDTFVFGKLVNVVVTVDVALNARPYTVKLAAFSRLFLFSREQAVFGIGHWACFFA